MKYRIKHKPGIGHFAQVKKWFEWQTIGKHVHGFGLYPESNIEHPITDVDALERCKQYNCWLNLVDASPAYVEVTHQTEAAHKE